MIDPKFIRRAKRVSRINIINALLQEYYDETLEIAKSNPKTFGDNSLLAEEDPRTLATQYVKDYRKALMLRDKDSLEMLYALYIQDREEYDASDFQ